MSRAPDKSPKPDRRNTPERFNVKLLLLWLGIVAVIGFLLKFSPAPQNLIQTRQIGQFLGDIEAGKVKSLTVIDDSNAGGYRRFILRGELVDDSKPGKDGKMPEPVRVEASGVLTDSAIEAIQKKLPDTKFPKANTNFELIILQLLPSVIIGGLVVFFIYRLMKSANKNALSFSKSRAKLLGKDKERATFKDVAGCDEAKEDVQEIIEYLRDPKKFQQIGGRIPKGVLLVGPPGTGKTLLARAVAGEADVPFFSISGSDFVEMFVGVGAARVRDMFEQARKSAPSILFIDEIDAVGRQRGAGLGGGHDEREQTLNSLLVEMDGIEGHEGIIVVAATNRADVLDAALLRPGRFDRHVYVDLPDIRGREEILQVHAKKVKLASSVDLKHVARITAGCSGAQLANLLNEAALLAARQNKKEIESVDIEQANDKISFGAERRRLMDEEDRRSTAFHEAGHAVVQALLDDSHLKLHKVTIIPRGRALGMAMFKPGKDVLGQTKAQLLNRVCTAMAGRIGEEVVTGDFSNGAASDIKQATAIARHMVCDWGMSSLGPVALGESQEHIFLAREISRSQGYSEETARRVDSEIHRIIEEQYRRAADMIASHADAHRKVAEALLEYETLDAVHVHEILEFGEVRTPVEYRPLTKRQREEDAVAAASPDSRVTPGLGAAPATV